MEWLNLVQINTDFESMEGLYMSAALLLEVVIGHYWLLYRETKAEK